MKQLDKIEVVEVMIMKVWRDDIKKEDVKRESITSASFGLLFLSLCGLIPSNPKLAIIVCAVLAIGSIVLSAIASIKLRKM